jgi:hypothetical protein
MEMVLVIDFATSKSVDSFVGLWHAGMIMLKVKPVTIQTPITIKP